MYNEMMNGFLNPGSDGVYRWQKGQRLPLSEYFMTDEFTCPCKRPECKEQQLKYTFLTSLSLLREDLGLPMRISSGFRCKGHQDELRESGYETATLSQHCLGNASDISCSDFNKLTALAPHHFMAIGIGQSTIHVDGRRDKSRIWYYSKGM